MSNIRITSLFPNQFKIKSEYNISSIYKDRNSYFDKEITNDLKIDELINKKNKPKQTKLKYYKQYLNACYIEITKANNRNLTHTLFTLPKSFSLIKDCSVYECLLYIEKKLRKKGLDTIIINRTLFIDWSKIEENIKMNQLIQFS